MICANCHNEMAEGYIANIPSLAIEWVPKHSHRKLVYKEPKKKIGFRLGNFWKASPDERPPAWYCAACNVIVIDCKAV